MVTNLKLKKSISLTSNLQLIENFESDPMLLGEGNSFATDDNQILLFILGKQHKRFLIEKFLQ